MAGKVRFGKQRFRIQKSNLCGGITYVEIGSYLDCTNGFLQVVLYCQMCNAQHLQLHQLLGGSYFFAE